MENKQILYPMLALMGWTFAVAVIQIRRTYRAVREGLHPNYFRHKQGYEPPGYLLSASQHFSNLFEMPVLFYGLVLAIYIVGIDSILLPALAWAYVISRLLHSRQHLSNRNLLQRRNSFFLSYGILLLMWILTVVHVALA